jgi:hypothetical protein
LADSGARLYVVVRSKTLKKALRARRRRIPDRYFIVDEEPDGESNSEALHLARELLEINPDAIKLMRLEEPTISRITADLILQVCPTASAELARRLAEPFY